MLCLLLEGCCPALLLLSLLHLIPASGLQQQLHMGYLLLVGYGQAHSQMGWHRAMQLE